MTKLSDTQRILLSSASQRDDGSLLPLPVSLNPGTRVDKALAGLLTRGLAEQRDTSEASAVYRTDDDIRFGLYLTAAGAAAIGVGEGQSGPGDEGEAPPPPPAPTPRAPTKTAMVVTLLQRTDGATLPELIAATGWLPHTTRAALTGIRKKGHTVERYKRDDTTCYRISVAG